MMRTRNRAFLFTAIPIVLISVISPFSKQPDLNEGLGIAWLVAGALWLLALLTALGLYMNKRKEIAQGILAGAAAGLGSLVITMIIFIATHQTE
jgi:peptidoglycan/LPS O-acetylase OafA/YrhL